MTDEQAQHLVEQSNLGTWHMLDGAQHYLTARSLYEALFGNLTESRFDQLAEEAWTTFVTSTIYSYYTWVSDLVGPSTERDDIVDDLLGDLRTHWSTWTTSVKATYIETLHKSA